MKIENNEILKGLIDLRCALETQVDDFLSNMDNDEVNTERLEYFTVTVPTVDGGETVHRISWNAQMYNKIEAALRESIIEEAEYDLLPLVHVKQSNGETVLSNAFVYDPINDKVVEVIDCEEMYSDQEPIELASAQAQMLYNQRDVVVCHYHDDENYTKRWYISGDGCLDTMTLRIINQQIKKHIRYIWE